VVEPLPSVYPLRLALTATAYCPVPELKMTGGDDYFAATMQRQPTYGNYPVPDRGIEQLKNDPTIPDELTHAIRLRPPVNPPWRPKRRRY